MARNRFPQPDVVRLPLVDVHRRALTEFTDTEPERIKKLPEAELEAALATYRTKLAELENAIAEAQEDGDWIEVKVKLNAGEAKRVFTDLIKDFKAGQSADLAPERVGITKILAYLVKWSFSDSRGPVDLPLSNDTEARELERAKIVNSVDLDSYRDLSAAIDWHDEQVDKERSRRKNARAQTSTGATI